MLHQAPGQARGACCRLQCFTAEAFLCTQRQCSDVHCQPQLRSAVLLPQLQHESLWPVAHGALIRASLPWILDRLDLLAALAANPVQARWCGGNHIPEFSDQRWIRTFVHLAPALKSLRQFQRQALGHPGNGRKLLAAAPQVQRLPLCAACPRARLGLPHQRHGAPKDSNCRDKALPARGKNDLHRCCWCEELEPRLRAADPALLKGTAELLPLAVDPALNFLTASLHEAGVRWAPARMEAQELPAHLAKSQAVHRVCHYQ
mmetsp:Transcript_123201/g.237522  ORF Transcript_123201/g.237522 Transcript_123201/m.237522 type:complete len:261 (-) Transcript_123201:2597-3379(-)